MVNVGKMMWNVTVKANCSRARRTGSSSIAKLRRLQMARLMHGLELPMRQNEHRGCGKASYQLSRSRLFHVVPSSTVSLSEKSTAPVGRFNVQTSSSRDRWLPSE